MDETIATLTNAIMADLDHRNLPKTEENFLELLTEYYDTFYFSAFGANLNVGSNMVKMVAVKQMIDALTHFDK